jgi:glyoxylase-like metal-dependent hydrolase (beta-lactamase superfamily II)
MTGAESVWTEIGDRVFVRRYRFYDQEIGLVLGRDGGLIVDTRLTHRQADEIITDVRSLTAAPITDVVNTHTHNDHCFGNHRFRPATIWGHERSVPFLLETGERQRAEIAKDFPRLAADAAEVVIDPPDRTFTDRTVVALGDRELELRYLGRGHTDNDAVLLIPDADVLFAGDLLENGAPPYFGDGYPLDWPATVEALLALTGPSTRVVPGHGDVGDRAFVESSLASLRGIADLARRIVDEGSAIEDLLAAAPWGGGPLIREALERGVAQARGQLEPSAIGGG